MLIHSRHSGADVLYFQTLKPAVMVLGEKGAVLEFSAGAQAVFGITPEQLANVGFGQCVPCPKEYQNDVARYLADYADNNPNLWEQPLIAYRYDGVRFPLVYRIGAVPGPEPRWVCEFLDASHQHGINHKLRQRLEETQSASQAKSRFLHHLSQQFRMPLARVLGAIGDALDQGQLATPLADNLEQALQSGKELQRTLNEMVDFIRLETDQLEFQSITFNFRLVLEEIADSFSDLARRRGIELATLVSPYVPEILVGDPDRLHQILQSLLSNAFKFTHEGGITVKAECQIENDTHAVIELEISDTGEGMPEEKAQAIRAALERREGSFADRYSGLGIGLAISKDLLGLMGGTLTLRSVEGLGTTFRLSLKMPKGKDVEANALLTRRHRIMMVTDFLRDRNRTLDYFQEWQLEVESHGSGPVALEKMRQASVAGQPYELVIIDLQQHKHAGVQLVQEINRNPAFASVRLLLLVTDRDELNLHQQWDARLDAVLLKPVRKQMLHDAIATVLSRDHNGSQPVVTHRSLLDASGRQTQRALLVDDNEVNQIIAKGALKKLGIHADVTNNGEEAIEAVMEKQYDFILMDCEMPIMDGFEATRCIREWEQQHGGHLPIIALTANDAGDCHDACMQAGMDEYMQKPFRADQLEQLLQKIQSKPREPDLSS